MPVPAHLFPCLKWEALCITSLKDIVSRFDFISFTAQKLRELGSEGNLIARLAFVLTPQTTPQHTPRHTDDMFGFDVYISANCDGVYYMDK